MPVIIKPETHDANPIAQAGRRVQKTAKSLLYGALPGDLPDDIDIYQSTWGHGPDARLKQPVIPSTNGLVDAIRHAYGQHHHLVIRPDDVWLAVLTQLSLYVNRHAEDLRSHFVAHEGKLELRTEYNPFSRYDVDFRQFVEDIGRMIDATVVDGDLKAWIMPDFTTTDDNDRIVAGIVMMGTLQKYYDYTMGIICGFPTVELRGEKADYEAVLARLDKLERYGDEPTKFAALLRPVLRRFIRSFEDPAADDVIRFWKTAFDQDGSVCGLDWWTGWLTAFCFWDEDGESLYHRWEGNYRRDQKDGNDDGVPADKAAEQTDASVYKTRALVLDGVRYHGFDGSDLPPAWTSVPFKMEQADGVVEAEMYAGLMGVGLSSKQQAAAANASSYVGIAVESLAGVFTGNDTANSTTVLDTMAPVSAWFITEAIGPKREAHRTRIEEEEARRFEELRSRSDQFKK